MSFPHKCHIAGALGERVLFIVKDTLSIDKAKEEIENLTGERVAALYPKDDVLLFKKAFSKHSLYKRLNGLYEITRGARVTVTDFEALLQLFPKTLEVIKIAVGDVLDPQDIAARLVKLGYMREEIVSSEGCFSLRGDIARSFP